jgi:uncharacterized protein (DUF433 family)
MTDPTASSAARQYVEETAGAYRLTGTRISLDSVVWAFLAGQTPESIIQSFPVLTLEQVYGALTYYLAHRQDIDTYLAQGEAAVDALRSAARGQDPSWYRKLETARRSVA